MNSHLADALNYASCALELSMERGSCSEARTPDLAFRSPIDMRQYAKGLITLWMGTRTPSDVPFTPGGSSALDIQAGFALSVAQESHKEKTEGIRD